MTGVSSITNELDLSIIIVSYNDKEILWQCLKSIYAHNHKVNFETIIINNGSILGNNLKGRFPQITLIENNKNAGFAKAVNQGIRLARGKYILSLNSDTILSASSLLPLVEFMDKNNRAGAAGGKILDSRGAVQPTCRRFPTYLAGLFNRTSFLTKLFPKNRFSRRYLLSHWGHNSPRRVDWVSGCYIIFRRETLRDVGFLDEGYFMYCEDVDWCYRSKQKGWKIYYLPDAELIHTPLQNGYTGRKIIHHHRSMYRFYKKHFNDPMVSHTVVGAGIFLRAIVVYLSNCLDNFVNKCYTLIAKDNYKRRRLNYEQTATTGPSWHKGPKPC